MKIKFNKEEKTSEFEGDIERIIEKGMDLHEKDWKDKFSTKHTAKKELIEILHKNSLETRKQKQEKKSIVKELIDGINENKQIDISSKLLEEERIRKIEEDRQRKEEKERKEEKAKKRKLGTNLLIFGLIIALIGFGFGQDGSSLQTIGSIGFISFIIGIVLVNKN